MSIDPTLLKRGGVLLLSAGLVYCNVATILIPVADLWFPDSRPQLPLPVLLKEGFFIFKVFSYYEEVNREAVIEGLPETAMDPEDWQRLKEREYFPFPLGERLLRIYAYNDEGRLSATSLPVAQAALAAKIKAYHNRAHPGRKIGKLRVYLQTWPRSELGYFAELKPDQVEYYMWHEE